MKVLTVSPNVKILRVVLSVTSFHVGSGVVCRTYGSLPFSTPNLASNALMFSLGSAEGRESHHDAKAGSR